MGEWRYTSTILDLDTRWRWVVSFTHLPLYSRGKSPRYPLARRLGWCQSRSGRCGEGKNLAMMYGSAHCHMPAWFNSALSNVFICILGRIWLMTVEGRAPCDDCNNNNNNKVILIVILIKIKTDSIFMTLFPEIFWSTDEITFICKQESAREGELSENRFMTPRQ
jgi:hypothetical protein